MIDVARLLFWVMVGLLIIIGVVFAAGAFYLANEKKKDRRK
jgi:hypothetical protein